MKLHLWKDIFWTKGTKSYIAFCIEHRIRLEIVSRSGKIYAQEQSIEGLDTYLMCPEDERMIDLKGVSFSTLRRRFSNTLESIRLKDAEIVSIDGYQIPIAKVDAPKDEDYWVQARINDTKQGKQLVVYAGKRGDSDKSQIFVDTDNEKISFDQHNIHPNDVFTKLVANFKSGKKATLEDDS